MKKMKNVEKDERKNKQNKLHEKCTISQHENMKTWKKKWETKKLKI